jgi:hypothetical protein
VGGQLWVGVEHKSVSGGKAPPGQGTGRVSLSCRAQTLPPYREGMVLNGLGTRHGRKFGPILRFG